MDKGRMSRIEEKEIIKKFEEDFEKTFYSLYPFSEIVFEDITFKCTLDIFVDMFYKGKKIRVKTVAFFREIIDSKDNSFIIYKSIDEFQQHLLEFRYEEMTAERKRGKE